MLTALLCAAVLLVAWRLERLAVARMGLQRAEAERLRVELERRLAMEERRLALEERRVVASLEPEEVPVDIRLRYEGETEPWAREQMGALVRELHNEHKNWDAVRQALGQLDAQAAHREHGWSQTVVS